MLKELIIKYSIRQTEKNDISNIKSKLAKCEVKKLTNSQIKEINNYYIEILGKKVPIYWHEYFYSRNGNFSVKYIPTSLYHSDIIYKLNNFNLRHAYVDKGLFDIYFPDVNRPETIVKNINGYYYDKSKSINIDDAFSRCFNYDSFVIKPSMEGMWGEGVNIISTKSMSKESISSLFNKYRKNFIIQEVVKQHDEVSKLNPTSLNTIRVLSYRDSLDIHILYAVIRIGRKGKSVDNETTGGINADINLLTGKIQNCAYGTPSEKLIFKTDVGTELNGFSIPSFHKVINIVKDLHLRLPYFNIIGWDFGIDSDENPILIEWNRCPDLSQTAHGPAFGDLTDEIFKRLNKLPDTRFVGYNE